MKSETTWLSWHFSADTLCQCYISNDGPTALLCWYDSSEWPWAEVVTCSQSMLNGLREFTTRQQEAGRLEDGWNRRRKTCCPKTEECARVSEGLCRRMCVSKPQTCPSCFVNCSAFVNFNGSLRNLLIYTLRSDFCISTLRVMGKKM